MLRLLVVEHKSRQYLGTYRYHTYHSTRNLVSTALFVDEMISNKYATNSKLLRTSYPRLKFEAKSNKYLGSWVPRFLYPNTECMKDADAEYVRCNYKVQRPTSCMVLRVQAIQKLEKYVDWQHCQHAQKLASIEICEEDLLCHVAFEMP